MRYIIYTTNTTLTKGIKSSIEEKSSFLDNFLKTFDTVTINIAVKKNRQILKIRFKYLSHDIILSVEDEDLYVAIDELKDEVKLKISKINKKIKSNKKTYLGDILYTDTHIEENEFLDKDIASKKIVKRKEFFLKPMSEEEAILQMELLNHNSFMFVNVDLDYKMCLLYKRKDGNYGIIESQIKDK